MSLPTKIFVILCEGAPVAFAPDVPSAREYLADVTFDGADLYQVYQVHSDEAPSIDITQIFAIGWAEAIGMTTTADPDEFLSGFTGFILAHARGALLESWKAAHQHADDIAFELALLRRAG